MNNLAKKRVRTVAAFTLWGVVIGAALGLIIGQFEERDPLLAALRGVAVGVLIGIGLGVGEELILPRWSRTMAFARLSVVRIGDVSSKFLESPAGSARRRRSLRRVCR